MELPVNSNTLFPANGAMEVRHILIFALQLPALQAGKRTVAHDVQVKGQRAAKPSAAATGYAERRLSKRR